MERCSRNTLIIIIIITCDHSDGLVVTGPCPTSAEDPGNDPCFFWSSCTEDYQTGTPVATLLASFLAL